MRDLHRTFGTHPDVPDHRDHELAVPRSLRRKPPRRVDLRPECPPVYDQMRLNSCSANAIAAALWFDALRRGDRRAKSPSRLFIYYNERVVVGNVQHNAPVSLRGGYKTVRRIGACTESLWPYLMRWFRRKPPPICYRTADFYRPIAYARIRRSLSHLKGCLAMGFPFTFGISVHEGFRARSVRQSGVVPLPGRSDRMLGGHALVGVGYDDAREIFIVRNSWGRDWGVNGCGFLPYEYLLKPEWAWDFWMVRRIA